MSKPSKIETCFNNVNVSIPDQERADQFALNMIKNYENHGPDLSGWGRRMYTYNSKEDRQGQISALDTNLMQVQNVQKREFLDTLRIPNKKNG